MTDVPHENKGGVVDEGSLSIQSENSGGSQISRQSSDKEAGLETCRVCQCAESEKIGDIVLGFLGIDPPLRDSPKRIEDVKQECKSVPKDVESRDSFSDRQGSGFVEFVSPDGEVFICNTTDMEMGLSRQRDTLVELGCSCKNDLALVHYACALKWFVTHGSTICEICGCVARNIKAADFKKVLVSLKDYELLRERTANGEPNPSLVQTSSGVDPDAVAAIRRQRLSEISLWFNPHNGNHSVTGSVVDESSTVVAEGGILAENPATRWAVEGTGILLATGLLTVTLAWLIAPRVGKKTAKSGLHILLGGICALTVVILFRFIVLTRIKYGPARYWAILFVFWFLVFGIWASRSHSAHTT